MQMLDVIPLLTDPAAHGLDDATRRIEPDVAYARLQQSRPQTLAHALTDSPAGLAAWIIEKFRAC